MFHYRSSSGDVIHSKSNWSLGEYFLWHKNIRLIVHSYYLTIEYFDLLDWMSKSPQVNIALLLLFAIIIFAIVGLEFYAGALNKTCYDINNLREFLMSRTCNLCVLKSPFC